MTGPVYFCPWHRGRSYWTSHYFIWMCVRVCESVCPCLWVRVSVYVRSLIKQNGGNFFPFVITFSLLENWIVGKNVRSCWILENRENGRDGLLSQMHSVFFFFNLIWANALKVISAQQIFVEKNCTCSAWCVFVKGVPSVRWNYWGRSKNFIDDLWNRRVLKAQRRRSLTRWSVPAVPLKTNSGASLVVRWLGLRLPMWGVQAQPLVRELGSHMRCSQKPKKH